MPGQCCGTCVIDAMSCDAGRMQYQATRNALYEKYSSAFCKVDSDCTIAKEFNNCAVTCGVALPQSTAGNWDGNIYSASLADCPNCPQPPVPPCPFQVARCSPMGRCYLGPPGM
jgi:hypothetical protein